MTRGMRFRPFTALLLVALLALAGCLPSDGAPGSPGVPVLGISRLAPEELVAYYRSHAPASLPYRVQGASLEQLAQMFVDEGNRYLVRGDVAFAQSIVETAWFNFPASGIVKPENNNYAGIGACDSCDNGLQFASPLSGVRAQIQLLRNYAESNSRAANLPDPPVPELWGNNPATAASNFDHFSRKGHAPLWNNMGNDNWASAPNYAAAVLRVYNEMLTYSGQPGQCPPDVLLFGPLTEVGPCPVALRQPGRAIAATPSGGYYVLNGDGNVHGYSGAPEFGHPTFDWDLARDIAVMPDGVGYVVLTGIGTVYKYGSAADPANLGTLGFPYSPGNDQSRSIAITPDGKGYVVLLANGEISKWGTAATGPLAALPSPAFDSDLARSIAVTPDGAGYLVLDTLGGVWKYGTGAEGLLGASSTPAFGIDVARDIVLLGPWGYYVLDAWGGMWASQQLPTRRNPRAVLFADRWRGVTIVGGQPVAVRNDGTTVTDYSSLTASRDTRLAAVRSWRAARLAPLAGCRVAWAWRATRPLATA